MQDLILDSYIKQPFAIDFSRSRIKLYNLPKVELGVSGRKSSGFWPPASVLSMRAHNHLECYLLAWW